jgi:uncharacterized protein YjeT (DUF2065 family)
MSAVSVMSIIFGIVIIVGRAPLVFAPDTTLRLIRRIINNKGTLRIVGIFTAVLGLALIASAWNADHSAALILSWLGWLIFCAAVVELIFTAFVQRIANAIWNMNNLTARILGVFAVVIGAFFVYLGIVVFQQ